MECGISICVATRQMFDGIHGGHRFRQISFLAVPISYYKYLKNIEKHENISVFHSV